MSKRKNMIQKNIDILKYLSNHAEGATLTEIATALDFPKTTVFDILKTLKANDFVHYVNAKTKSYGVGAQCYAVGMTYFFTFFNN